MKMEIGPDGINLKVKVNEVYAMYFALEYFSSRYFGDYEWAKPIARDMASVIYSEDEEE